MIQIHPIKNAYLIPLPTIQGAVYNLQFNFRLNQDVYTINLKFYSDSWHCWVTFPDLSIREAGFYPNDVSWTAYDDYGLFINTDLPSITQTDLNKVSIYLLAWDVP